MGFPCYRIDGSSACRDELAAVIAEMCSFHKIEGGQYVLFRSLVERFEAGSEVWDDFELLESVRVDYAKLKSHLGSRFITRT